MLFYLNIQIEKSHGEKKHKSIIFLYLMKYFLTKHKFASTNYKKDTWDLREFRRFLHKEIIGKITSAI